MCSFPMWAPSIHLQYLSINLLLHMHFPRLVLYITVVSIVLLKCSCLSIAEKEVFFFFEATKTLKFQLNCVAQLKQ